MEGIRRNDALPGRLQKPQGKQLELLFAASPVAQELADLDITAMTPMEAINTLYTLQQKAKNDR